MAIDISPGDRRRGLRYHVRRIRRVSAAASEILKCPGPGVLYTVFEAGAGVIYVILLAVAGRATRRHLVLHHHTAAHVRRRSRLAALLFSLCGRNALHVALSDRMARDLAAAYPEVRQVEVAHNAAHVPAVALRAGVGEEGPLRLGFLANLTFEKGLDLAVLTARAALEAGVAVRLIIAGSSHNDKISAYLAATEMELSPHVEYRGAVYGEEKERFFQDIDVFIFPTKYKNEAQPLVLLEAMAAGRPCIVTNQGYTEELVGNAGLVAPVGAFIDSALRVLSDWSTDRQKLEAQGQAALARYMWLRSGAEQQFAQLIRHIASNGRPPAEAAAATNASQ